MSESDRCTSCGGPRNHFVDGVLRKKCAKCNDYADRTRTGRSGPSVYQSRNSQSSNSQSAPPLTTDARRLLIQIDELLEDESYMWAEDTLSGIKSTVLRTGTCSEAQQRAVDNIENSRRRGR